MRSLIRTIAVFALAGLGTGGTNASAQTYTSFFTGDTTDVTTNTSMGICMMGGATEHDEAMRWFLNRSGGGDIVVIRSTGTNGYNTYLYSTLGVTVNSVETIVISSAAAANDPYVRQQLRNAEAIWIAGGDQYDYVSFWKNSAVDSALNDHVNIKHAPIGGTSAGMAIIGSSYNTAQNGSITSAQALADPYSTNLTLDHNDFLHFPFLQGVITDTHYDNPDRRGRHFTFMARITNDLGMRSFGIACDEYTAVCIDSAGIAHVYGDYPNYDDNAYFLQANCIAPYTPETIAASTPLTWDRSNAAVKVYHIQGDWNGTKYFDLNDWETGSGGTWENWYAIAGQLNTTAGAAPNCSTAIDEEAFHGLNIYPNPAAGTVTISGLEAGRNYSIAVYTIDGMLVKKQYGLTGSMFDVSSFANGLYLLKITTNEKTINTKLLISN